MKRIAIKHRRTKKVMIFNIYLRLLIIKLKDVFANLHMNIIKQ